MSNEKILNRLSELFADILDLAEIKITENTRAADIDEWDSLTHIQLIVAIEKEFGIKFTSSEISNWKNVGEMLKTIDAKGGMVSGASNKNETGSDSTGSNQLGATYKKNYVDSFELLEHGQNCFIAEGVTITNVKIGDRVWINKFATIYSKRNKVTIGSDCYIGPYVWIEGQAGIEMGNFVHIAGPGTSLYTHSGMKIALNGEKLGNPGYDPQNEKTHLFKVPIRIGNNVWIGPNCSISPGVVIQDFVVVMPNTVVKSGIIESYSLVSGNGHIERNSQFVKSLLENK